MTLPGSLVTVLSYVGLDWPDSDEDKLREMGDAWMAFSKELTMLIGDADRAAAGVWKDNRGEAITAFQAAWTRSEAPSANLREGAAAAAMIAEGLYLASKIVIALKLKFIAELGALAVSIARAVKVARVTRGASLLVIPLLRWMARRAIEEAISHAIAELTT